MGFWGDLLLRGGMTKEELKRRKEIEEGIEKGIKKLREKDFCNECGKRTDIICQKKSAFLGNCEKALCLDCAKKCKKCRKYYCSKHINNHKC